MKIIIEFSYNVSCLLPAEPLTDSQKCLMYGATKSDNTVLATAG